MTDIYDHLPLILTKKVALSQWENVALKFQVCTLGSFNNSSLDGSVR